MRASCSPARPSSSRATPTQRPTSTRASAAPSRCLSTGPSGGNGAFDAIGKGLSRDAIHVFFETKEQLVSSDTDARTDVYEHDGDGIHIRTLGPGGTSGNSNTVADDAAFLTTTENGLQMWFRTNEKLSGADANSSSNAYRAIGSDVTYFPDVTTLDPARILPSPDGSRLVFESSFPLGNDPDANGATDVFSLDFPPPPTLQPPPVVLSAGDLDADTSFVVNVLRGASRTGTRVVFETEVALKSEDTDTAPDLYQRTESGTILLTGPEAPFLGQPVTPSASFEAISENGGTVMFSSREKLTAGDDDGKDDVFVHRIVPPLGVPFFERVSNGLTGGSGAVDALAAGLSADGSHAYVETTEALTAADTDGGGARRLRARRGHDPPGLDRPGRRRRRGSEGLAPARLVPGRRACVLHVERATHRRRHRRVGRPVRPRGGRHDPPVHRPRRGQRGLRRGCQRQGRRGVRRRLTRGLPHAGDPRRARWRPAGTSTRAARRP